MKAKRFTQNVAFILKSRTAPINVIAEIALTTSPPGTSPVASTLLHSALHVVPPACA